MTATGRASRLGVGSADMVPGFDQRLEDRRRKRRRAHEDEVERFSRGRGGHRSITAGAALGRDGNSAALCFGELAQDHATFHQREVVDKQDTVEVLDLVLQAGREETLGVHLTDLVLVV